MGGPAGLVNRLVEIERGANSTEARAGVGFRRASRPAAPMPLDARRGPYLATRVEARISRDRSHRCLSTLVEACISLQAQFFLDLEARTNFYFSLAFTALTLVAFVIIGRRLGV